MPANEMWEMDVLVKCARIAQAAEGIPFLFLSNTLTCVVADHRAELYVARKAPSVAHVARECSVRFVALGGSARVDAWKHIRARRSVAARTTSRIAALRRYGK